MGGGLLGCDVVWSCRRVATSRRNMLPPLIFSPEGGGCMFLRNVGIYTRRWNPGNQHTFTAVRISSCINYIYSLHVMWQFSLWWVTFQEIYKFGLNFLQSRCYVRLLWTKIKIIQELPLQIPNTKFSRNSFNNFSDETYGQLDMTSILCIHIVNFYTFLQYICQMTVTTMYTGMEV